MRNLRTERDRSLQDGFSHEMHTDHGIRWTQWGSQKGILRGFSGDMAYKWIPDYRAAPSWILRLRLRSRVLSTVLKRYEAQLKHLQPLNNRSTGCENSLLFRLCWQPSFPIWFSVQAFRDVVHPMVMDSVLPPAMTKPARSSFDLRPEFCNTMAKSIFLSRPDP